MASLPDGFVLNEPVNSGLPPGFQLDPPKQSAPVMQEPAMQPATQPQFSSEAPPSLPGMSSFGAEVLMQDLPPNPNIARRAGEKLAGENLTRLQSGQITAFDLTAEEVDLVQNRRLSQIPELGSVGIRGIAGEADFPTAALALLTTNVNEFANILTSKYPQIGVSFTKEGRAIAVNNETGQTIELNKPGISPIDVFQGLGIVAALTPATRGATMAPAALRAMAAKGAGTQAVIEGAQVAGGGEFNPGDVALTAAALPIGQVVGEKIIAPAAKAISSKLSQSAPQKIKDMFTKQSPFKEEVKRIIASGESDNITAKYILNGAGKIKSDPIARDAIKQGFDDGVIASIKGSTDKDRAVMLKMVNILKKGKANKRFSAENRPTDAVGDSVLDRFRYVVSSNKEAGSRLEKVSKSLKGKSVDFDPAVAKFLDDLDGIGVSVGRDLKPKFSGSDIEGLSAPENIINRIVKRMTSGDKIDAYDVHRMKKFIDEQVTFGKTSEGLGGKTENILKSLRRNLDQALDSKFPKYNEVNTQFADTISALDNFKDAAGTKFNPLSENAEKFVGNLSRRLLSNVQSRITLLDSLNEMQKTAIKYGAKFDDDILTQAMFADEIARMFGSSATTSFEGGIEKGVQTAIRGKAGVVDIVGQAAVKGAKSIAGVNEENAIKSIEALLKRGVK